MPNPTPSQIVESPRPLNPSGFPFVVLPFPADILLRVGDFNVSADSRQPQAGDVTNYEPGQH